MPTYDYVCAACEHALEIFQPMSEAPKKKCPKCGKSKLERRIGAGAGFLFKGSGFYLTDYRSKAYTAQSEAERKSATSTQPPPETPAASPTSDSKSTSESKSTSDSKAASDPNPTTDRKPTAKADTAPKRETPSKSAAKKSAPSSTPKKRKS